jgi:hypothetical protein
MLSDHVWEITDQALVRATSCLCVPDADRRKALDLGDAAAGAGTDVRAARHRAHDDRVGSAASRQCPVVTSTRLTMARNLPLTIDVFSARAWLCLRSGAMIESEPVEIEPVPSIWSVLLFRIAPAEQRECILSDWEENVFGLHLRPNEKGRLH